MLKDYLKKLKGRIGYLNLITYFLDNFRNISKVDTIISEFQEKIFNITDTPEQQMIRTIEVAYPGEYSYSFMFQENENFGGIFDLDFVDDTLANFRSQLFSEGFLSFIKVNNKYSDVLKFLIQKYDEGIDKLHVYDKTWYDNNKGLIITLRKVKLPILSISLAITAEEFNPSFISLIEAYNLKKR